MTPRVWQVRLRSLFGWSGLALGSWAFCLLVLQVLFGQQLEQLQTVQLGRDLALNVRLTELALERYPPHLVTELTGLDLTVAIHPKSVQKVTFRRLSTPGESASDAAL